MITLAELLDRGTRRGRCLEWTGARDSDHGYGRISIAGRMVGVHRLSWSLVNGPIPPGILIRHNCDNPPCFDPEHLLSGSHADNRHDADRRGRSARPPVMTPGKVRGVRLMLAAGHTVDDIAVAYEVSYGCIHKIAKGITWRHIV